MKIQIKDIQANPFRDIGRYPINQEKVAALRKSIQKTGFWDNVVARKANGSVELAYGHHRLVALKEEFDLDHEVDLIVRDLSDENMIRIMANENMDEWANNAAVTIETVRAIVAAFAAKKIKLPIVTPKSRQIRKAPRFEIVAESMEISHHRQLVYTAGTIANFLGWRRGVVGGALTILETLESDLADDADFDGINLQGATNIAQVAKGVVKEDNANKGLAKKIIREATKSIREGKTTSSNARSTAQKIIAEQFGVRLPDLNKFAERLSGELHNYLAPEKQLHNKLKDLLRSAEHIPESNVDDLVDSLDRLSRDSAEWADKFREYKTVVALKEIS